jgi:putative transposase
VIEILRVKKHAAEFGRATDDHRIPQGDPGTLMGPDSTKDIVRGRCVDTSAGHVSNDLLGCRRVERLRLARAIADAGFGAAVRMLGYKTTWNGGTLIPAGRWYPSSKTCSGCGAVKAKLARSERAYRCHGCGLALDRDVNAAANLLGLAVSGTERRNACGGTVRPGTAGHVPVNQEPGTAHAGKTGTASGQPLAAGHELTYTH